MLWCPRAMWWGRRCPVFRTTPPWRRRRPWTVSSQSLVPGGGLDAQAPKQPNSELDICLKQRRRLLSFSTFALRKEIAKMTQNFFDSRNSFSSFIYHGMIKKKQSLRVGSESELLICTKINDWERNGCLREVSLLVSLPSQTLPELEGLPAIKHQSPAEFVSWSY